MQLSDFVCHFLFYRYLELVDWVTSPQTLHHRQVSCLLTLPLIRYPLRLLHQSVI
ncbi:unnamed protein product [Schistosoma margrebowiei]|uniref:Uncharacterized protein n=1 Tax=Schistosoma margrebowiei TaxID=48269 RepID=A0A3P8A433_9TREM|nr:unnamed protein product [Schistosoma margrebowiei]